MEGIEIRIGSSIYVSHTDYRDGEYLHINARFLRIGIAQFFIRLVGSWRESAIWSTVLVQLVSDGSRRLWTTFCGGFQS